LSGDGVGWLVVAGEATAPAFRIVGAERLLVDFGANARQKA